MRTLRIQVKPNSRESTLHDTGIGVWLARLKSPPVDGKANAELITLVARHFDVSKAAVKIKLGGSARLKVITVATP